MVSAERHGESDLVVRIDGTEPISADNAAAVTALCDRADDRDAPGLVVVHVSGAPGPSWPDGLTVGLVNKWERALRRLERLDRVTVGVASGDCGGTALDALLATDVRIATPATRLLLPEAGGATWPGMALYRLTRETGTARFRLAALLGVPIEAAEAHAAALLDELADDPAGALAELAATAASLPRGEPAIRRRLVFDASTVPFEEALGAHLAACDRALRRSVS
ncbi:enoyl-CoA-hydratase DpgB [Actinomadura algeriensis]|uniref:Isomerase DpgB n=1 Tax=Actinomadura algeriensis TaxID=1679523 RepID=A0ABR9JKH9_9ACTN|nr:enoyl-CoA-hydratase DpgB [Actinomadura algeriensis]MBE1530640.1 isomerase DpgB [Actinomadura algeriensis]